MLMPAFKGAVDISSADKKEVLDKMLKEGRVDEQYLDLFLSNDFLRNELPKSLFEKS